MAIGIPGDKMIRDIWNRVLGRMSQPSRQDAELDHATFREASFVEANLERARAGRGLRAGHHVLRGVGDGAQRREAPEALLAIGHLGLQRGDLGARTLDARRPA